MKNELIASSVYELRREKLRSYMHDNKLEALLISYDANRFYLSGFELHDAQKNESSGVLIIAKDGKDWLCTDSRFYDAAKRLWPEERIFIYAGNSADKIAGLMQKLYQGTIGFESRFVSVDFHKRLAQVLGAGQELVPADGLVERLRLIKEPLEIACLEKACALNHKLMEAASGMLKVGRTEAQVAWDIEQFFRNNGASELSFESIVAVGANSALPHAVPSADKIIENCAVLVDVGCRLDLYCSDQTRTFWVGDKPDSLFTSTLNQVKEAQQAAIAVLKPGVPMNQVYAEAVKVFDKYGVAKFFTHGLGHGIGLETHEGPSLNALRKDLLEPGMVVTVEPGLYYSGVGGVRWEYMALITDDGYRIL